MPGSSPAGTVTRPELRSRPSNDTEWLPAAGALGEPLWVVTALRKRAPLQRLDDSFPCGQLGPVDGDRTRRRRRAPSGELPPAASRGVCQLGARPRSRPRAPASRAKRRAVPGPAHLHVERDAPPASSRSAPGVRARTPRRRSAAVASSMSVGLHANTHPAGPLLAARERRHE